VKLPELAAATVLLLLGVFGIVQARALPYWHERAPGPGFVPFWLGVLLTAVAALILLAAARAPQTPLTPAASRAPVWISVFAVAALIVSPFAGVPVASGLFMAATLFLLEPERRRRNVITAIATFAVVSLLFVHGLGVPLPLGPFGF
jgi:hypothetical protein